MAKATATKQEPAPTTAMTAPDTGTKEIAFHDYGEDAGAGFENVGSADQAIPFLNLLQGLSKVVKAKRGFAGDLYNTVTEEVYKGEEGILVVPATTGHEFVEWKPRETGGGFVASHRPDAAIVKEALAASTAFGEYFVQSGEGKGNELQETFNIFAALVGEEPGDVKGALVIPFASTKIKAYKGWIGRINSFQVPQPGGRKVTPPMFSHLVRLRAESKSENGNDWHVYRLEPADMKRGMVGSLLGPDDPRFQAAKAFREIINAGRFRLDYNKQERGGGGAGKNEGPAPF